MIRVQGLTKRFRVARRRPGVRAAVASLFHPEFDTIEALRDVSFSIDAGELVGYIGPNGAGKSTTIKVMSGILVPDGGSCEIGGRVPWKDRVAHVRDIGVVFGQRSQLWWDVPVEDSFELLRDIYRIPPAEYAANRAHLVELLELAELLGVPTRQLSLGQRMRCEIAASLLHGPKLLFLDEPTIGLDAPGKLAVRRFIRELNRERGVTVVLTSHDMNDIEALARRIILIGKGSILYDGALEELRERYGDERTVTAYFAEGDLPELPELPGAVLVEQETGRARWALNPKQLSASAAITRLSASLDLQDVKIEDPPVEELIARLYREHRL